MAEESTDKEGSTQGMVERFFTDPNPNQERPGLNSERLPSNNSSKPEISDGYSLEKAKDYPVIVKPFHPPGSEPNKPPKYHEPQAVNKDEWARQNITRGDFLKAAAITTAVVGAAAVAVVATASNATPKPSEEENPEDNTFKGFVERGFKKLFSGNKKVSEESSRTIDQSRTDNKTYVERKLAEQNEQSEIAARERETRIKLQGANSFSEQQQLNQKNR